MSRRLLPVIRRWLATVISLTAFGASPLFAQNFVPSEKESTITFHVRNFGVTVDGSFSGLMGNISFETSKAGNSSFDVSINSATVETGIALRNKHLRQEGYFNSEVYPKINLKSTSISPLGTGRYRFIGLLTIRNVSRSIEFEFTTTKKDQGFVFEATFTVDRTQFGVGTDSLTLANDVIVELKVRAIPSPNG